MFVLHLSFLVIAASKNAGRVGLHYQLAIKNTILEKNSGTIFQTAVILEPFDLGP